MSLVIGQQRAAATAKGLLAATAAATEASLSMAPMILPRLAGESTAFVVYSAVCGSHLFPVLLPFLPRHFRLTRYNIIPIDR